MVTLNLLAGCDAMKSPFGPRTGAEPKYTILCLQAQGPAHAQNAEGLAQLLRDVRGIDPHAVRLQHEPDVSRVYYGQYRQRWNRTTGVAEPEPAARTDLERIRQLSLGGQDTYPFLMARVVSLPRSPVVPGQWELSDCPGAYTLQIGVFYDTPPEFTQRREAAEQAVKLLRDRGYQAWYHHGDARSTIFVGSFDESAVMVGPDGRQTYSQPVIDLQQSEEDFRYNTHNGRIVYRNLAGRKVPEGSVLIRVPRGDSWGG
jgi:hypothetical protein